MGDNAIAKHQGANIAVTSQNERDGVSNDRRLDCLLNRLFRLKSKEASKLHVTGLCEEESTSDRWIPLTKGQ